MPVTPTLKRWWQDDQKFKTISGYKRLLSQKQNFFKCLKFHCTFTPPDSCLPQLNPQTEEQYLTYLALLGGSYCKTQLTSGISIPRAITSVHTRIPLAMREQHMSLAIPFHHVFQPQPQRHQYRALESLTETATFFNVILWFLFSSSYNLPGLYKLPTKMGSGGGCRDGSAPMTGSSHPLVNSSSRGSDSSSGIQGHLDSHA